MRQEAMAKFMPMPWIEALVAVNAEIVACQKRLLAHVSASSFGSGGRTRLKTTGQTR